LLWLETISLTPPGSDQGLDSAVTSARYSAALVGAVRSARQF